MEKRTYRAYTAKDLDRILPGMRYAAGLSLAADLRAAEMPDEEIGRGVDERLPADLGVDFAYTFDDDDLAVNGLIADFELLMFSVTIVNAL